MHLHTRPNFTKLIIESIGSNQHIHQSLLRENRLIGKFNSHEFEI